MKVLIGIPHTGNIRAETCGWLVNTLVNHPEYGLNLSYGLPVDSNRNKIVKSFLTDSRQRKFNWLLFVDSDVVPPLGALQRLLSHKKKVVSAVCWSSMSGEQGGRWEKDSLPYPVVMKRDEKGKGWKVARAKIESGRSLIEVDAVGASCVLINREVLQKIGKNPFRLGYDEWGMVTVVGEDFDFCLKVKEAGYKIYADLTVQCEHYKTVGLRAFNKLLEKTARSET